jgi:hypothetical protein
MQVSYGSGVGSFLPMGVRSLRVHIMSTKIIIVTDYVLWMMGYSKMIGFPEMSFNKYVKPLVCQGNGSITIMFCVFHIYILYNPVNSQWSWVKSTICEVASQWLVVDSNFAMQKTQFSVAENPQFLLIQLNDFGAVTPTSKHIKQYQNYMFLFRYP